MSNTQKPEPRLKHADGSTLDLHSIFYTIQGEGPFAGHRSIFVRLAGCNLQCPGCDTEYTEGRMQVELSWILRQVMLEVEAHCPGAYPLIVITGGEPLRQPIGPFVRQLIDRGFNVQIESNGVFAPDEVLHTLLTNLRQTDAVTLVVSPKTKQISRASHELASCFKYVLQAGSIDERDGLPILALEHPAAGGVARPREGAPVYVNPYDEKDDAANAANLAAVALSAMKFGHIAGVQMHKLIGLE